MTLKFERLRSWQSLVLSLFVFLGVYIHLWAHAAWYESTSALGTPALCKLYVSEVFMLWIPSIISLIVVFFITDDALNHNLIESLISRLTKNAKRQIPSFTAVLNSAVVFITYIAYLILIPNLGNGFSIGWIIINAGIVGVATSRLILYHSKNQEEDIKSQTNQQAVLESYRLEHSLIISLTSNLIWATIIVLVSVVFIIWSQVVYPSFDQSLHNTPAFLNLPTITIIQVSYVTVGVFFGLITQLFVRASEIQRKTMKLEVNH
jgi:hypothetical protein